LVRVVVAWQLHAITKGRALNMREMSVGLPGSVADGALQGVR